MIMDQINTPNFNRTFRLFPVQNVDIANFDTNWLFYCFMLMMDCWNYVCKLLCRKFFVNVFFTDQMQPKFFRKQNGNCRLIIKVFTSQYSTIPRYCVCCLFTLYPGYPQLILPTMRSGDDDEILRHALEIFLAKRKRIPFLSLLLRLAAITPSSIFEFVIVQFSESSNPNK